jgi:hypothetical protein
MRTGHYQPDGTSADWQSRMITWATALLSIAGPSRFGIYARPFKPGVFRGLPRAFDQYRVTFKRLSLTAPSFIDRMYGG